MTNNAEGETPATKWTVANKLSYGFSGTISGDISVEIYIKDVYSSIDTTSNLVAKVTMLGETTECQISQLSSLVVLSDPYNYSFTFSGITAQYMATPITFNIYNGDTLIGTYTISFEDYLNKLISSEDSEVTDKIKSFCKAYLAYGAASTLYWNDNNGEEKDADKVSGTYKYSTIGTIADESKDATGIVKTPIENGTTGYTSKFSSVKLSLGSRISILISVDAGSGETPVITYTNNKTGDDLRSGTLTAGSDGYYRISNLDPTEYGDVFVITMKVDEYTVQTLSYSVNTYCYRRDYACSKDSSLSDRDLVDAIYSLGLAAKNLT